MATRFWVGWLLFPVCLLAASTSFTQTSSPPVPASVTNFQFSQVDLKLLEEVTEFDRQLSNKGLVLKDPEVTAYVQGIGERLLAGQPPPERVEFKFRVLRDPSINAFALPNGSIYVQTGLIALLNNEGELASVIAHEITHVTNRHAYLENRSYRKKMVIIDIFQAAGAAGAYFPAGSVAGAVVAAAGTIGQVMTVMTIFGYSQEMEREADRTGIERLYNAGYDPHAMPLTFELLDERLEYEPMQGFYRDHPKLKERQQYTQEMAEKLGGRDKFRGTEADYLSNTAPAICYNIRADQQGRRVRTALARAKKLTEWRPQEPIYLVLEGDSYRLLGAKTAIPSTEELEKHGQAEHRKRYFKLTEDEEQKELLNRSGGEQQLLINYEKAEKYYLSALEVDFNNPDVHRSLGFLYQAEGKKPDAAREYQKYLELAPPDAPDRLRVKLRLTALQGSSSALQAPPTANSQPLVNADTSNQGSAKVPSNTKDQARSSEQEPGAEPATKTGADGPQSPASAPSSAKEKTAAGAAASPNP